MDKLSIVIPVNGFGKAGGYRVLSKLANEFMRKGHNVTVLSYYKTAAPYFPIDCEIKYVNESGNEVSRKDTTDRWHVPGVGVIKGHLALLNGLNKLSFDYSAVIANANITAYAVNQCKIRNKYYYVQAYEVWYGEKTFRGKILNMLAKHTYSMPLIKIVNAEIYRNYKEIHSNFVVPPGLDLKIYYPKNDYFNGKDAITVGCIGRVERWKGTHDVAAAVEMLQKQGVPVKFLVAFNPADCADFELVKPDGDSNLADYYRSLDILVAPGTIQLGAIHYPVIEAMACGTPVITTGYYPADNDNSYIVPVSSPKDIAKTICHIINNYAEAKAKAKIALNEVQRFDWDKVSEAFLDVIRKTYQE